MSVLAFAPCEQPLPHEPRLMHGERPLYSSDVMALSDGHQCQPRRLEAAGEDVARGAQREWREGGLVLGVGWVPGEAGDAHHLVVEGVEGLEGLVGDGPVVGDAVVGADSEVAGREPGVVGGPEDGAAADGVEHQGLMGECESLTG